MLSNETKSCLVLKPMVNVKTLTYAMQFSDKSQLSLVNPKIPLFHIVSAMVVARPNILEENVKNSLGRVQLNMNG